MLFVEQALLLSSLLSATLHAVSRRRGRVGGQVFLLPGKLIHAPWGRAGLASEAAEGVELSGGEDAPDAEFRQRAQARDGGLRRAQLAHAVFDDAFVRVGGIDGFVERAAGLPETRAEKASLRLSLAPDGDDLRALFGRQIQGAE